MSRYGTSTAYLTSRWKRTGLIAACLTLSFLGAHAQVQRTQQNARFPSAALQLSRRHAFIAARRTGDGTSAAAALMRAHLRQNAMAASEFGASSRGISARPMTGLPANFSAAWQPLGPSAVVSPTYGNLTGRITAVAPDPNDPTGNTVYLGSTGGGVWKSTNAAGALASVTFAPLTDTLPVFSQSAGSSTVPSLSIGAVAVQPASTAVVLAGTGDPSDASDSLYGEGLLRSADGGATWTLIQSSQDGVNGVHSFAGLSTAGIAWSTATTSLVVAAFTTSPQSSAVQASGDASIPGLYYSTDAGVTWQMATLYDGASVVQTPQPLGTGEIGNAATSVVWDALRGSFYAAVRGHGYYASTDGANWTRLTHQPGTNLTTANCPVGAEGQGATSCPIFRGTLAVQPATGDLYALTVDANDLDQGLWQDLCNASNGACTDSTPAFANRIDNGALEVGNGSTEIAQGDYNFSLAAAPAAANGTLLFAGTIDLYRCSLAAGATSCTWRDTTNALDGCDAPAAVAPAQHALAAVALASGGPLLFLGNDGGLWRSTDGVAETGSVCAATDKGHFDNLNAAVASGGSLAEIIGFAQPPADTNTLIAGLGANGSAATSTAAQLEPWPQLSAGEGGIPLIDPTTPTNWFVTTGAGVSLTACTQGTSCAAANFTGAPTIGETQVDNDQSLLDTPLLLDPAQTTNLITATCRVWRGPAASSSSWSTSNAISAPFSSTGTPCGADSPLVRSLAAGGPAITSANAQNSGSSVLYAGLAGTADGGTASLGGHVFETASANADANVTAWTDVTGNPVTNDANNTPFNIDGFDVSSVVADPHDPTGGTVYATIQGFGGSIAVSHVYRSTDFGAHWLNVTANLPDAPANALVVDPNDANTVYVATDAGVYATQAITTCPTQSCWNLLGTGLPNAPVTSLEAAAQMPTGNNTLGMLRAGTYGRGIWQIPLLDAVSTNAPAMTLSTSSLTFASQQVGTVSATQSITVSSSGAAPLVISTLAVAGDFTETDNCAGQTLAVGASCTIQLTFAPTATGTRTGSLTVFANVSGGQASASLTGTATAGASIVLTPLSLTFSATTVGQTSASQIITVANTGGATATLQTPAITGDFTIAANTCTATLAASTACSISITFTPTASGARSGALTVADSEGTQIAQLTGTGQAPATDTLAPLSLAFAQQIVGTDSSALEVTLTNSGDVALTLLTASSSSSQFAVTNGCGATLAGHASCAISVVFAPSATGTQTATLTVGDQFRAQTVSLTGTGIAPAGVSLTPSSLSFPATGVGLSAPAQTVTLTNNGGVALTISSLATSGDFVLASNTCGTALAPNQSCTATIVFSPTAAGNRTGALTVADNGPGGTQTVALSGTGVDFTLTADGPTSATTTGSGGTASYALLLSSAASVTSNVALNCTGAPTNASCTVTPATATLGSTLNVAVQVATGVMASSSSSRTAGSALRTAQTPRGIKQRSAISFALAAPWLLLVSRRRRNKLRKTLVACAAFALILLVCTGISGCGATRTIPGDTGGTTGGTGSSTTTPSGSYSLTISATAAGITHTTGLTLVVQ